MALGEQLPVIRIQVDQRLPVQSGVAGEVRDDSSVSSEITYFDRVGDFYILEGALTFSGGVQSGPTGEPGHHDVQPFSYRLPYALRIPVAGQPNFLEVTTRIGKWRVRAEEPDFLQLQAELTVQGLNGRNGYSFYCGDQEDWVQPQPESANRDMAEFPEVVNAPSDVLFEDKSEDRDEGRMEDRVNQKPKGYDEKEWMMEAKEESDVQDTLVYEPGSDWQKQLNAVFHQASAYTREQTEEAEVDAVADVNAEANQDRDADTDTDTDSDVREEETSFQFEALADEVVAESTAEPIANPETGAFHSTADSAEAVAASEQVEAVPAELVAVAEPAGETESQEDTQPVAADDSETVTASAGPTKAPGPKLSFGAKKEEITEEPLKLSGLAFGSVTKNLDRSEADGMSAESNTKETVTTQAEYDEKQSYPQTSGMMVEPLVETSDSSVWGKWIQKESEARYTLKFRIIQESESLEEVANSYQTPIENLMRANGMTNEQVETGQVLLIPGRRR
ncbi:LysM peptidoglycan-binding domain-containing protein [Effusibacillus lacus]|uniref:LysM domain-containing protein n=1 Tax=Effusibacillus lacus TaxID=1348429 RepID=A0A292YHR0_9BACL|nr:LysM peptidoglycan-binding domain-containing protein [Effusibacillus lacus]TCS76479.1 stage VI sporulation protein D [Effusibacillus lacus]GAX90497.1 hypothetical protein EFBL_2124 [Effusibacillus lacus]